MGVGRSKRNQKEEEEEVWPQGLCKIVVVGDGAVGKTCLVIREVEDCFPGEYIPTVYDYHEDKEKKQWIFDTAGQEDYDRLRPLSYPRANCFLLCFSVVSSCSFENINSMWIPEVEHHCPKARNILVALKCDLREDKEIQEKLARSSQRPITFEEGKKLADKLSIPYLECSALTGEGVDNVFRVARKAPLSHYGPKRAVS